MEAIIFIGIQAAGKSTFYKQKFFKTHMHINLDMLKTRNREDIFIDACIKANQSFVIDNTNPSVEERKKYITISKKSGFDVIGYYFQSNINDAITRNETRTGKEFVPVKGIACTYNKLVVPNYSEGFDKLYYVSIDNDNNFLVEEWKNEL
ncbi:MAG: ATP-binding protein [Bacillota bacterium]|nr:ATP-binding protein [Bacillota bacterium]